MSEPGALRTPRLWPRTLEVPDVPNPTCTVPDCAKVPRSPGSTMCAMHYHRQYRHGSVERTEVTAPSNRDGSRYRMIWAPGHPLANKRHGAYEHRVLLYDLIGEGPHPCAWCARPLVWLREFREDGLEVDHVNGIRDDNRPENLVPACHTCNSTRARQAKMDALRAAGWWSRNDTIAKSRGKVRQPRIMAGGDNTG